MSSKNKTDKVSRSQIKKKRNVISLKTKVEIIRRYDKGEKAFIIANTMNLPPTTVRTIIQNSAEIRESATAAGASSIETTTKKRPVVMEKMENALILWIKDLSEKNIPVTTLVIQRKAISLFNDLKSESVNNKDISDLSFNASGGWLDKFKKRAQLHNIKVVGESASADSDAAKSFPQKLKKIIDDDEYTPQQVFNVDETGLFWKRMPGRTFISKEEKLAAGPKVSKDRLTLLLGGNAAGDLKLKPLLVYKSETPRAMKNICKQNLPVIWMSNKKAWITSKLFNDWFKTHFCPEVKKYCERNNLSYKALLLIDNAPGHSISVNNMNDNIKIVFLPPNTTSLIQPMDQGVIAAFKKYYLRRSFNDLIDAIDNQSDQNDKNNDVVRQFWKKYDIMQAVNIINKSWEEVSASTMRNAWKNLWPECTTEGGNDENLNDINTEIVRLAHTLGLSDIEDSDVVDYLNLEDEPLTNSELIAFTNHSNLHGIENETSDIETCGEDSQIPFAKLSEAFASVNKAMKILEEFDTDDVRVESTKKSINASLKYYRDLYEQKKLTLPQKRIDAFFKPILSETPVISEGSTKDNDIEMIISEILSESSSNTDSHD